MLGFEVKLLNFVVYVMHGFPWYVNMELFLWIKGGLQL